MNPVGQVVARLQGLPEVAALLPGGIYGRDLKRVGPGATPTAYAPSPPYTPVPAAVVVDDGEVEDPGGPPLGLLGSVSVWVYAARVASGRDEIAAALEGVRAALLGWSFLTPRQTPARFEGPGLRLGTRDDPVDEQRLVDRVVFAWHAVYDT